MIKSLFKVSEGEKETLADLQAIRLNITNFPEPIEADIVLSDSKYIGVAKATGVFSNIFLEAPKNTTRYDLVYKVSPNRKDADRYSTEDAEKKEREMRKFLPDTKDEISIPKMPYNYIHTAIRDVSKQLSGIREGWDITKIKIAPLWWDKKKLDFVLVKQKPEYHVDSNTEYRMNRMLMEKIKTRSDERFYSGSKFCILSVPSELEEEERKLWWDIGVGSGINPVFVDQNGFVWNTDKQLDFQDILGLLQHRDCMVCIGVGWMPWAAWGANVNYSLEVTDSDDIWLAPLGKTCGTWNTNKVSLQKLNEEIDRILAFYLQGKV